MKILLLSGADSDKRTRYGDYSLVGPRLQPYNLMQLTALLERDGHIVHLLDTEVEPQTLPETFELVGRLHPDLLGVSVYTINHAYITALLEGVRSRYPKLPVVLGGPHMTIYPAAFVERGLADYGVAGEADLVFPELVSALERGSSVHELANVTTLREGKVVTNPTRPFIDDLDALPFPAFHLLGKNLGKYWPQPMTYRRKPMTIVVTSRGCPYDCSFCPAAGIWAGRRWRAQSAEYVGNLMEWLSKDYGIREICFNENTFALDRHRVEGICNFILKKRLNILWSGNVNARHLHADLLALMHRAGCWLLSIGIETGDAGIMSSINKPLDLAQAEEKIKLVVSKGIKVRGYFIVGHQEETEASVRKTIALAKRLPLYTANFSIFVPVPGSRDFTNIYGEVAEHAIGDLSNYANLGCGSRYQPAHLSGQRVIDLQRRAMFEFFLRPSQVGRLVRSIETFEDFRRFAYMGLAGTNIVGRSLLRKVRNPTA